MNAFVRCNVRAKPKATSIFWILSANGTTLSNDEVIDDCWTVIRVRVWPARCDALGLDFKVTIWDQCDGLDSLYVIQFLQPGISI